MLSVDAKPTILSSGLLYGEPDLVEITVEYRSEAPTANTGQLKHQRVQEQLEDSLLDSGAEILPVRHDSERKKLLKKGVFGHGVRSSVHTRFLVRLPLSTDWGFWERVHRAQALRELLHNVSDISAGLTVSQVQWGLADATAWEQKTYAVLRTKIEGHAAALGAEIAAISPSPCSTTIDGPTRIAFSAAAHVRLRPLRPA
ncbi:MAG: hypothetical protein KC912_14535 [Proteobacteria bacterium]|nr:hypothetical protein [Pseudomonadota bacterium]